MKYIDLSKELYLECDDIVVRGPLTWHGRGKCWPVRISRGPVLYGGSRFTESEPVMLQEINDAV